MLSLSKKKSSLVFFNSFPNFRGFPLFFRVQWTTYILHHISIQYGYSMFETHSHHISIQYGYSMFETHSQNFHDVMTSRHQNIMQLLAQRHKHWQCPVKTTEVPTTTHSILKPWPRGYKTPTTPNSTEHENSPAHKLQNANNGLHFNIYERKPALQVHLSLKNLNLLIFLYS